jgi:hypothetical protein
MQPKRPDEGDHDPGAIPIEGPLCGRGALELILIRSGIDRRLLSEYQLSTVILEVLISALLTSLLFRFVWSKVRTEGLQTAFGGTCIGACIAPVLTVGSTAWAGAGGSWFWFG